MIIFLFLGLTQAVELAQRVRASKTDKWTRRLVVYFFIRPLTTQDLIRSLHDAGSGNGVVHCIVTIWIGAVD